MEQSSVMKKTLYLVYWNNNEFVGGYEKRRGDFCQVFNDFIDHKYAYTKLKAYNKIEILTEDEFSKIHKIVTLEEWLEKNCGGEV